MSVTI